MIRKATKDDIENINIMFKSYFDSKIKEDVFTNIYVFEHEKVLGFISYSVIYERCELNYIAVLKEYQNNHIASKLMEFMIENTKDLDNITLEVNVNNKNAIKLYEKYGFKVEAIREKYYNGVDGYLMIRRK